MGNLSAHFDRSEFRCKCGNCQENAVSPLLIERLESVRELAERPIVIRSGCRCPAHNVAEGGKADSAHLTDLARKEYCEAADIETPTTRDRFYLVQAAIRTGVWRIGIGKNFIHLDVDAGKDDEVMWLY